MLKINSCCPFISECFRNTDCNSFVQYGLLNIATVTIDILEIVQKWMDSKN